jgi:hypothetical protein
MCAVPAAAAVAACWCVAQAGGVQQVAGRARDGSALLLVRARRFRRPTPATIAEVQALLVHTLEEALVRAPPWSCQPAPPTPPAGPASRLWMRQPAQSVWGAELPLPRAPSPLLLPLLRQRPLGGMYSAAAKLSIV